MQEAALVYQNALLKCADQLQKTWEYIKDRFLSSWKNYDFFSKLRFGKFLLRFSKVFEKPWIDSFEDYTEHCKVYVFQPGPFGYRDSTDLFFSPSSDVKKQVVLAFMYLQYMK